MDFGCRHRSRIQIVFVSVVQASAAVLPRPAGSRPGCRRTHPCNLKICLRTIHRLLNANSIVSRAVFLARPR